MYHRLVRTKLKKIRLYSFYFTGNTPPDYRQTDMDLSDNEENNCKYYMKIKIFDFRFFLFLAKSPSDRPASKFIIFENFYRNIVFFLLVVRTTRADPRHNRKHVHHRHQSSSSQQHFDDADERSYKDNSNSSPLINGENKTTSQVPMIDVNLITDLLIQHSQSTGFEKSLEMLTQTLRQLTDPNVSQTTSSQPSSQISQSNPFENLLMKRLQPPIPPPVAPQVWFNSTTPQSFPSSVPPFFPSSGQRPPNAPVDFHSQQQQYQNQRN
jgi:hypothetical protein